MALTTRGQRDYWQSVRTGVLFALAHGGRLHVTHHYGRRVRADDEGHVKTQLSYAGGETWVDVDAAAVQSLRSRRLIDSHRRATARGLRALDDDVWGRAPVAVAHGRRVKNERDI